MAKAAISNATFLKQLFAVREQLTNDKIVDQQKLIAVDNCIRAFGGTIEGEEDDARTFQLPFKKAYVPASDRQIEYLRSYETFKTKISRSRLSKYLDKKLASEMLGLLEQGITIELE